MPHMRARVANGHFLVRGIVLIGPRSRNGPISDTFNPHHRQRPWARRRWLRDRSCSRLLRSAHLSDPSPKLFYRILPNGVGWYWEINDSEGAVLERGVADEHARARAHAFAAAFERQKAIPEPYPEGKKRCPDTFSI
jgi:hypothetical protein